MAHSFVQPRPEEANRPEGPRHAVSSVSIVNRRQDQGAWPSLVKPVDDLFHILTRRQVVGHPISLEVPANRLGPEHVAFEPELGLADRHLLLVVEPGGSNVTFPGEYEDLGHRQPPAHGVLMNQACGGDRAIIGMWTEHD
jgi:hypothetical protein